MTIEEAYQQEFMRLVNIAKRHLINIDYAIDCVHEVFKQRLERKNKTGREDISVFYLIRDVTRQAQKMNKDLLFHGNTDVPFSESNDNESDKLNLDDSEEC